MKNFKMLSLVVLSMLLWSCSTNNNANTKPIISVAIAPVATLLQEIVGEHYEVQSVVPAGIHLEDLEVSLPTVEKLNHSELFVSLGTSLETNLVSKSTLKPNQVLNLANIFNTSTKLDPHVWMNPLYMKILLDNIVQKINILDPSNTDFYNKNLEKMSKELSGIMEKLRTAVQISNLPYFIIYHPFLGHLAKELNIEQIALEEEGKPATVKQMQSVLDKVKDNPNKWIIMDEAAPKSIGDTLKSYGFELVFLSPTAADYKAQMQKITQLFLAWEGNNPANAMP